MSPALWRVARCCAAAILRRTKSEETNMAIKDLIPRIGRGRDQVPVRRTEADPFRGFQREMNRLFDDFVSDLPLAPPWGERGLATAGFSPRVDVSETDKEVRVSAELPGMDEKDITVEMDDTAIIIRGEKKEEKEEKGKNWYSKEQSYGSFHRIVPLPASVQDEKARAKFNKGILTITVPKRDEEQAKGKAIRIETE
jgi:HSP20 family protein